MTPKTRPQVQQRWPRGAEGQRRSIRDAADDLRELIAEAQAANDDRNPILIKTLLALMEARTADIQRLAVEARVGAEPVGE